MELEIPPIVKPSLPQPDSSASNQPAHSKKRTLWIAFGSVIAFLVIIAAGSYVVFGIGKTAFGNDFQNAMWSNVVDSSSSLKSIDSSLTATYQDNGTFDFVPSQFAAKANLSGDEGLNSETLKQYDQMYSFDIANLKSTTSLNGFYDTFDPANTQASVAITSNTVNANTDYGASLNAEIDGNTKYIKYDYNQAVADSSLLKLLTSFVNPSDDKGQWIKTASTDADASAVQSPSDAVLQARMETILKDNRPVDIRSFKGFASINGHETVHYVLSLNTANLRTIISDSIKLNNPTISQEGLDYQMQFVDSSIAKTNVNDLEVWVSPTDHHIYKFIYQSNAVSLTVALTVLENNLNTISTSLFSADGDQDAKTSVLKIFQSLPYTAQITIQNTVQSYDTKEQVQPPITFKDESEPLTTGFNQ
jgi:hypothetical protein